MIRLETSVRTELCAILRSERTRSELAALPQETWLVLAETSRREGVASLLRHQLRQMRVYDAVAPDAYRTLEDAYVKTRERNLWFFGELARLERALPPKIKSLVLLKGAVLAASLYPNITLRPLGDVDLLVRETDLHSVCASGNQLGYALVENVWNEMGMRELVGHHLLLTDEKTNSYTFEIHWDLMALDWQTYLPPTEWFWANTEPLDTPIVRAARLVQFNPTAQFIHLATHLFLHHVTERRLVWLYDLHLLLVQRGAAIDWEEVQNIAHTHKLGSLLHALEIQLRESFGTGFPTFPDVSSNHSAQWVQTIEHASTRPARYWRTVSNLKGRTRLEFLARMFFPSTAFLRAKYHPHPAWLVWVYYPYRWLIFFIESVTTLVRGH